MRPEHKSSIQSNFNQTTRSEEKVLLDYQTNLLPKIFLLFIELGSADITETNGLHPRKHLSNLEAAAASEKPRISDAGLAAGD